MSSPIEHPEERGPIRNLDHVELAVHDLEAAIEAWAAFLGCRPTPLCGASFRFERSGIDLVEAPGMPEGLRALVFGCDDLAASLAELSRRGVDCAASTVRDAARGDFVRLRERAASDPSGAPPADASAVRFLDHVVVRTSDPDAARAFYEGGLGLRLPLDRSFPQWNARMMFFRSAGVTVEVTAALDAAGPARPDSLYGLAFRVDAVAAAAERLRAAGFSPGAPRPGRKQGTHVFEVADAPSGVPVLILGRALANTPSARNV
ncbi:MAG: VOC family protein [Myxococcales bacterium]|nr:VOC family protein [Myxococcales bacterium]